MNEIIKNCSSNKDYTLCVIGVFSFVCADYDCNDPIRLSSLINFGFSGRLSNSYKQKMLDVLQVSNFIEHDDTIGWVKLTTVGLVFAETIKKSFYEEDFEFNLIALMREFFLDETSPSQPKDQTKRAEPSSICTLAGTWYALHDRGREIVLKVGDTFPAQKDGPTGGITWYWKHG